MNSVNILGVKINNISQNNAIDEIDRLMLTNHALVCTPNVEFLIRARKDNHFSNLLNNISKMNLPDSFGLLWAAKFSSIRLTGNKFIDYPGFVLTWFFSIILIPFCPNCFKNPIKERISGSDFVWPLAEYAAKNKYRLFLLGGAPTVAERVALKLQTDIYGLRIAGVSSGSPEETGQIVEAINKSKADILIVAFGSPKQEFWLEKNLKKTCCKLAIGVGGTFDFIAGERKRAPKLMRKSGLEWLYRLFTEPTRIKRQLAIPKFMWLILIEKLRYVHTNS